MRRHPAPGAPSRVSDMIKIVYEGMKMWMEDVFHLQLPLGEGLQCSAVQCSAVQ